jgi:hypothetical protein
MRLSAARPLEEYDDEDDDRLPARLPIGGEIGPLHATSARASARAVTGVGHTARRMRRR